MYGKSKSIILIFIVDNGLRLQFRFSQHFIGKNIAIIYMKRSCKLYEENLGKLKIHCKKVKTMKRVIYLLVIVISITLIFTQGKPCCKNKEGKEKVSCKLNKANIEANQKINVADEIQLTNTSPRCTLDAKNTSIDKQSCPNCTKAPWWKIWGKKKGCCNTST